jgi:DNA-binding NarL/FixJ family response regulator
MKTFLPNPQEGGYSHVPTLVVAMQDLLLAEMISEWQFNCNFRNLAVIDDGKDIIRKLQNLNPKFLLIDSELPNFKGFDLAEKLKSTDHNTKIIIYASRHNSEYLKRYLDPSNKNIVAFIHTGCGVEEFEHCLSEVFVGKKYLSNCVNNYLCNVDMTEIKHDVSSEKVSSLASREREVWDLMTQGKTERQISDFLCIGIATVKTYKKRIKDKLNFIGKGKLSYLALKNTIN